MATLDDDAIEALTPLLSRVDTLLARAGDDFPYFSDPETGELVRTPDGNWCGGHWIGLLWLADYYTSSDVTRFAETARRLTDVMHDSMPRNSMFFGMNHLYAGFRAYDLTGDRRLFGLGLAGADAMARYYHEGARQIPLGELPVKGPAQFRGPESEHGPSGARISAVDNVYTALPVLWRAYNETASPWFRDVAVSHADRHLDWFIRSDGSTWHHAVFAENDGELERQYNELARSDDSCWARGQGWNIAGLARAYRETHATRYLDGLDKTVGYYLENSPDDCVPFWDFAIADPGEPRDTSAAALAAYGLTRLSGPDSRVDYLRDVGRSILTSLISNYLVTDADADDFGMVRHGCFNRPGDYAVDAELIWTHYYVAYTLHDLFGATTGAADVEVRPHPRS